MPEPRPISHRPVAGTRRSASRLGFRVAAGPLGDPAGDARRRVLLRKARARGVTTFDLPYEPGPPRSERLLAEAFPEPDPELLVVVGRSLDGLARETERRAGQEPAADLAQQLRRSLSESAARLAPQTIGLLRWTASSSSRPAVDAVPGALRPLVEEGLIDGWVLEWDTELGRDAITAEPEGLACGALSLLEPGPLSRVRSDAPRERFGFFDTDPLAAGRLDGRRFDTSLADRGPTTPPPSISELEREFRPVLELGFLGRGTHRTLAQSALQFAWHWPWVVSALVPLPGPERLDEFLAAEGTSPLSEEEIDRVLRHQHAGLPRRPAPDRLK